MGNPDVTKHTTNAIEFLVDYIERGPRSVQRVDRAADAVAAVDALYQAAKALGDLRLGPGGEPFFVAEDSAWRALAAAVRRVEADA